ncbi:unnamed protein product [Symbiodinium sp. CCMP2456]|nr:unnamed protein product [Symbiodinium sp. CCMP2456]
MTCSARRCGKRSQLQRLHEIQAQTARGRSLSPAEAEPAEPAEPAQAVRSAPQWEAELISPDLAVPGTGFSFPDPSPSFPRFPRPAPSQAMAPIGASMEAPPRSEFLRHLRELEADLELAQSLRMRLPFSLAQRIRRLPIRTGLLKEVASLDPEEATSSASVTLDLPLGPRSVSDLKDRSSAQEPGVSSLGPGLDLQMALEKEVRAPLRELQLVLEQVKARQDNLQRFLERADVQSVESRYPSPKVSGRRMPSPQPSRSFQLLDEALAEWPNGAETFAPFREQRCPRSGDKVASHGESPESLMQAYLAFLKGEVDGAGLGCLAADMVTPNRPEEAAGHSGLIILASPRKLRSILKAAVSIIREHGWEALHGRDSSGPCWTALHWAAAEGRNDVCLLLLGCRADPNHEDEIGRIPAYYANLHGYADTAVRATEPGFNVMSKTKRIGEA